MNKTLSKTTHWLLKHTLTVASSVLIIVLGIVLLARSSPGPTHIGENIITDNLTATGTITEGEKLLSEKYVPLALPTITTISPTSTVENYLSAFTATISGTNFPTAPNVKIDDTELSNVSVSSPTSLTATVPTGFTQGTYDVKVSDINFNYGTGSNLFTVGEDPNAWCNNISGWRFYTTNEREGCWSKTLADSVSWNKNAIASDYCDSNDCTASTGAYTCVSSNTLAERMAAASAGQWYKIVESVGGHTMATDGEDGQSGAQYISALAIADCIDGERNLGAGTDGTQIAGSDWEGRNTTLRNWAGASGKSALPYLATNAGDTQATNDYWDACSQNDGHDIPLGCTDGLFYKNRKVCGDGAQNYSWAAAVPSSGSQDWDSLARGLGGLSSCSDQNCFNSSDTSSMLGGLSFRVVIRP